MNETWKLDSLYPDFDSQQFSADGAVLLQLSGQLQEDAATLAASDDPQGAVRGWLERLEEFEGLYQKLSAYAALRFSADASDEEAANTLSRLRTIYNATLDSRAAFRTFLHTPESRKLVDSGVFGAYTYYLKDVIRQQAHALSPGEEEMLAALELTGSRAWTNLHTRAIAAPMRGEEAAQLSAAALNAIKGEVWTVCRLRKYDSPLRMALDCYHFDARILENQIAAVEAYLPKLRQYFRLKAQKLGSPAGLPYDMREELILRPGREFPFEAAQELILDAFGAFSPGMRQFAAEYFANRWIDRAARPHKETGASCDAVWQAGESRLRMWYRGTVNDVNCLAHELGHGYHFKQLFGQSVLNCRYDLPVAEVPSKFSELLFQEQLRKALPEQDRLFCEEFTLSSCINTIVDIAARFHFEAELFAHRKNRELSVDELDTLMRQAQRQSYGDTLAPERQNVRTWVTKPHYYSAQRSFYNFPYQFGALLAIHMFERWREDPPAFAAAYDRFLSSTGRYSVLELCKILDMNLLDPAFFTAPLQRLTSRLEAFQQNMSQVLRPIP